MESYRTQRKLTIQDNKNPTNCSQQSPSLAVKPSSAQKKSEKIGSNPEKKDEVVPKQFNVPKFLEKKNPTQDLALQNSNKTQRTPSQSPLLVGSSQKKTFTPKCNKTTDDKHDENKIAVSYSSADLLKQNHVNSPTCQSVTSRILDREKSSINPNLEDFKRIKFLGEGKFGQVHLVLHSKTNTLYALKQIKKDSIAKNKMQEQLLMQIKMQFYLNHPNILKLYGVFNDEENIYLILQYME